MRGFFKIFFASLLSLIVFTLLVFFFLVAIVGGIASKEKIRVLPKSVLVLDLNQPYAEQFQENPLSLLSGDQEKDIPGLYDVIRLLQKAKTDKHIEGILLKGGVNPNGFAASEEIRNALLQFKESGKFIMAHADVISQRSYAVANVADKIYIGPHGYFDWSGFNAEYLFLKGTLDKLDIQPQIFYAGKFKSATEPLRSDRMSEENRLQTSVWLNDLYDQFLQQTSVAREIDTATLRRLAVQGSIRTAADALEHKLVDGLRYDDEVKDEIKERLGVDKYERINFISINAYRAAVNYKKSGSEKIAIIYAEGDIVDGSGEQGMIGGDSYRNLIRKARLDRSVKAIVLRINSGGGSAMASENMLRELILAKEEKPVIVSFGDVAASGGYYMAAAADSIFALPGCITGSIGVFGIIPNMQGFFKNKLGVTFDGVKTAPYADAPSFTRPMNENEKKMLQAEIENIYSLFKKRVAEGRRKDTAFVETIAQGRVWTGQRAIEIGLIDRFGGIDDAVKAAAAKAGLKDYFVREYPEPENIFDQLFGKTDPLNYKEKLKQELGEEQYRIFEEMRRVQQLTRSVQARLPFEIFIQ